jgi:hypothetical protein
LPPGLFPEERGGSRVIRELVGLEYASTSQLSRIGSEPGISGRSHGVVRRLVAGDVAVTLATVRVWFHSTVCVYGLHMAVCHDDRALACEAVTRDILVPALTETPHDAFG